MVRSFSFWFIMVKIPEDLKDGYKKTETEASQMRIWFSMACKVWLCKSINSHKTFIEFLKDTTVGDKTELAFVQLHVFYYFHPHQRVREITGHSMREVFTIAALNSFPFLYDKLCPPGSEWHKNGGAAFYMR